MGIEPIKPGDWAAFCQRFTRRHRGMPLALDKSGRAHLAVREARLVSIELRGKGRDQAFAVTYRVINIPVDQSYLLRQPRSMHLELYDNSEQTLIVRSDRETVAVHALAGVHSLSDG